MPIEVGQLIESKYRIVRLLGEGGMGAVYEGENVRIQRRVAIKVLHSGYTGNAEVVQRFEREAQAAGRIGNDHILEIIDLGSFPDGDHFIVMEYLDGEPLSARIQQRGRLNPVELTPLVRQVLIGLEAAHLAGIVHRDLKPDNIYLLRKKAGNADFVKIIDFGISKFQPLAGDGMKMTRTGAVMGTPYYMSPEQASGSHEADQRSDLYSVGVILFEAVTGRVPFEAATFNQLMFKIVLSEVPSAESLVSDLDHAYSSIISKAMARDVNHRFQTAREFIQALDEWTARGTAVSLPPSADPVEAAFPPAARPGPAGPGAKTAGNWVTSHPKGVELLPLKRSKALPLALGLVALLVLGGGGLLAIGASDGPEPSPSGGAAAQVFPPRAEPSALEKALNAPKVEPAAALQEPSSPPPLALTPSLTPSPPKSAPVELSRRSAARPAPWKAPAKLPILDEQAPKGTAPARPAPARPSAPDFGY